MPGRRISKNNIWPVLVTLILTGYQLVRIIGFINVYGGIEHDGGWMLTISRSLAEQGTYTTMVSTIVDPAVRGDINVDQKFDIQAGDGRIWFFTGNGIGPASIVPDALILAIFGSDFWALRAGPLIFYTLFLLLAAYILYQLAGLGAIVLFHGFLFFYPHLSVFLSYEAMGEVPGMVYVLGAYLAFGAATLKEPGRWRSFFVAGFVVGLALITKLITMWSLSGIFVWAGMLWLAGWFSLRSRWARGDELAVGSHSGDGRPAQFGPRLRLGQLLALAGGTVVPVALWELVHLVVLTRLAGFEMYLRQTRQRIKFILDDGSGVGLRIHSGPEFFWDKFFRLAEVAHPQRWVTALIFAVILLGGAALLWQWRGRFQKQNLLAPLWLGWLANSVWFVSLAKTGWPRHFWFGLVLAVMLLSVIAVNLVWQGIEALQSRQSGRERGSEPPAAGIAGREGPPVTRSLPPLSTRWAQVLAAVIVLTLIGWGFLSQPHVFGFFLPDEIVPYWREKQINDKYGASLPWIIIPRQAQNEVVDYIKKMPPGGRVYFPGGHKSAEIPPLTGRMHYPLNRRSYGGTHPADIVLIGPSIVSPWKDPIQRQDLLALVERECPQPALQNDYYIICPIADNLTETR